jgi:hypothetical protein
MGRAPLEDGPSADSYGRSQIQSFAFPFPASSAGARSLLVPGTCDLTHRRTDASDSAAPCAWNSPTIRATLNHLFSSSCWEWPLSLRTIASIDKKARAIAYSSAATGTTLTLTIGGLTVNVCATVEKVKHPARKEIIIPCHTRTYAIFEPRARTEFRHDSCNTAPG